MSEGSVADSSQIIEKENENKETSVTETSEKEIEKLVDQQIIEERTDEKDEKEEVIVINQTNSKTYFSKCQEENENDMESLKETAKDELIENFYANLNEKKNTGN